MRITVFYFLGICLSLFSSQSIGQETVSAISFNIRYDTPNDLENAWPNRKEKVVQLLRFYAPDFFGLQEALLHQVSFVDSMLVEYSYIGVGRDDGLEKGEFSPLFYRKDKMKLLHAETIWLSKTPYKPSTDWDAALPRIATLGTFSLNNKDTLVIINTHYDHKGEMAREESSKVILDKIKHLKHPMIVMGDFNAPTYSRPIGLFLESGLLPAVSQNHLGPMATFNGFGLKETGEKIDHIFYKGFNKVLKSATLTPTWAGRFASDHHAVYAEIRL